MKEKWNLRSLMELPLGTRIWIKNGAWYGRICGTEDCKQLFVEATKKTYNLNEEYEADWEIVD